MKGKKQQKGDKNEQILSKLLHLYKRKCDSFGIIAYPTIKTWLEQGIQSSKLQLIKMHQPLGPAHTRAVMEALQQANYGKIKSICIWKSKVQDEGTRNICKYLTSTQDNSVEVLDLLQNQLTELSCEFIGKCFTYPHINILHLKLDNNLIGDQGLQSLSIGLKSNFGLTKLSLKYCNITAKGIKFIQQILAHISTKIRSIKLQGNSIGNIGIYEFLKVVQINQMLQKINIADTGLNLLDFKAEKIEIPAFDFEKVQQQNYNAEGDNLSANISDFIKQTGLPISPQKGKIKNQKDQQSKSKQQEQIHIKYIRNVNANDDSLSANIVRLLTRIMNENLLIRKYDLRFNPISNDAAFMLFQIIQQNSQIKDVEFNNNVDSQLRENLDTLMRKRTGRLPKRRGTKPKKKKK